MVYPTMLVGFAIGTQVANAISPRTPSDEFDGTEDLFFLIASCISAAIIVLVDTSDLLPGRSHSQLRFDLTFFALYHALPVLWFNYNVSSFIRRKRWS